MKAVIPGCVSVKMLKPYSQTSKAAIVKMECTQLAAEYLTNLRDIPSG